MIFIQIWTKNAVILSEGEVLRTAVYFGRSVTALRRGEPQSKDLLRPSAGFKKRPEIPPHKETLPQIAHSSGANLPDAKEILRHRPTLSLVPKLHLGTSVSPQLRCSGGEAQLRRQVRSQVQLGNEERGGNP